MTDTTAPEVPPVGEPEAPAAGPPASLQAQLRAAAERAAHRKTVDLEIPGYDGRLFATFRALDDYVEVRKIVKRHEKIVDEAKQELYIAADTLVAACMTTFAVLDGAKHPLDMRLGLPLASYLGHEGLENDRQAVFTVIPSTMNVIALFAELDQFIKRAGREVHDEIVQDELLGEAAAAS